MEKGLVSIIIRTKNEEKWISSCMNAVLNQDYDNFEVINVDNNSTDKTVEKLKNYKVQSLISNDEYRPGKLLNQGIRISKGEFIVCLSGHCIPVNNQWLSRLILNFEDEQVAGVYGRQEPLSFTPGVDKRDLINTFRLEKIIQSRDSFFHNANSMIRRSVWERVPFDEEVTNIEDRIWGKAVIEMGMKLVYEPEASVYHYHGINQSNNDEARCSNIVRILEKIDIVKRKDVLHAKDLNVIALVPIKGNAKHSYIQKLIRYTIKDLKKSSYMNKIYVITDDKDIAVEAEREGAVIPFLRPKELSKDYMDLSDVFKYALDKLEESDVIADLVVLGSITYPFRPEGLIDTLINELIVSGTDTVIATYPEFRISWKNNGKLNQLNDFMPRIFKNPIHIGMFGLGCITYPFKIRNKEIFADKVGIYEIENPLCPIEIRTESDYNMFSEFIDRWFSEDRKKEPQMNADERRYL